MCIKFIDISEHNTILSLEAIKDSNLKGVIMKATEGTTYLDRAMDIFYEALKDKNNIGFYHYLTFSSSPITQAQSFWNKIKDKQYQIKPVLDVEEDLGKNAEWYTKEFIKEFYRLSGQTMLIYSGRCYIEENFTEEFRKKNNWWVADYSANDTPSIRGCNVVAWQYTDDSHSYAFALGNLDVNILVDEDRFFIKKEVEEMNDFTAEQKARQAMFKIPENNNTPPKGDNITPLYGFGWIEATNDGRLITHISRCTYYSLSKDGRLQLTHLGETRYI